MPIVATAAVIGGAPGTDVTQTTTAQMQLALAAGGSTYGFVQSDYNSLVYSLCNSYGTCCYTDLCNSSERIQMNFVALISMTFIFFELMKV